MIYTITTTDNEDELIGKAADAKGLSAAEFVAAVSSKALVGVAQRVLDDKAAADRAAYLAAYDNAEDKTAVRAAVDAIEVKRVDGP